MKRAARRGSLRARMLVSATLVLALFLGVMGLVVDNAFRRSAEQAVAEQLLIHIYGLIAVSDEASSRGGVDLALPDTLQEPRFNSMGSGLLALVFDADQGEIWRSRSALELDLDDADRQRLFGEPVPGVATFGQLADDTMFFLSYRVLWHGGGGRQAEFVYVTVQDMAPFHGEVVMFRNNLWGYLALGMLALIAIQGAIMHWGLKPIGALRRDIEAIEAGEREYLEGDYPREIEGVTRHFNLLLKGERRQREHYRMTLADLAHSLKTPLAILKAQATGQEMTREELANSLDEQTGRMNDIVSYQLERAVIHGHSLTKQRTAVAPVVEKLINAQRQVYRDKVAEISAETQPALFPGDERDLFEMLGNLVDNACKYCKERVHVAVRGGDSKLTVTVEDDGDGIPTEDRGKVLVRGARLDMREPGQGIGLAVVAEIVHRHGGEIAIEDSEMGGALVRVVFG